MKKHFSLVVSLFVLVILLSQCKKEKTVEVYFTTSSVTANRGDQATNVTLEFSQPTTDIVELNLQSIGTDPIRFGSYNNVFLHDDSEKCQVTIDNNAFIDTTGNLRIGYGVKKVNIKFTPQFDNFPHAVAEYKVKLTGAKNAVIRSGSDVFTYHINQAEASYLFQSTIQYSSLEHTSWTYHDSTSNTTVDTMLQQYGSFGLTNFTCQKNGSTYDLFLSYALIAGASTTKATNIVIAYHNFPLGQVGNNLFTCGNNPVTITWNPPLALGVPTTNPTSITCSDLTTSNTQFLVTEEVSPVYGNYNQFTGNITMQTASTSFIGYLNSDFILF